MRKPTFVYFLVAFLAVQTPLFAGGPIGTCQSGQPMLWPGGGANIPFNPDQGNLGPLDNAGAVAAVQGAFDTWGAVGSSTASFANTGPLPVNVDITNFFDYLFPLEPDGLSAIVFDDTGEIFDLLFGPGSGILGFAGPEWIDFDTCQIVEGVSFLNGPAFADLTEAFDVMVHEFGHYTGLAHTVVNGQVIIGDTSGPTPDDTFGFPALDQVETMYPFYFGPGMGMSTLHTDDIAALSTLYPAADFFATTGTISGVIFASNGMTRLTGVNVIARNLADPFDDAVSAISSDFGAWPYPQEDPYTGVYAINGLTPGASYAVFVDGILAGGFSTPPLFPLPGPEEFFNGDNESNNLVTVDEPLELVPVPSQAGLPTAGIDVIFNAFRPGDPLPVGLDEFVQLFLPFPFRLCEETYDSVFVNANGNLTFGTNDYDWTESVGEFLAGPPKVAAHWDDLNNLEGGIVTFDQTDKTFTVKWIEVPEYVATGSNTFQITLVRDSNHIDISYGDMTATDGLAGVSCGGAATSGFETEVDLSSYGTDRIDLHKQPAVFELFDGDNDLTNSVVRLTGTTNYNDNWAEPNNSVRQARKVTLPFNTIPVSRFSEIEPAGNDVDFYRFQARAGETLVARIVSGQLDSLIGLFQVIGRGKNQEGLLLAFDDDSGPGLLSTLFYPIPEDGEYALAVTTFPDFDFVGAGFSEGRYVLDLQTAVLPSVEGTVYAVNPFSSSIVQFDVQTGLAVKAFATPEPASGGPDGLSQMNGSLFFVNGFGTNNIYELSSADGSVLNSFPAPVAVNGTDGLASSGGYLYSLDFSADTIFKIDPATGAVLSSCVTGLGAIGGLAGADGRLFAVLNYIEIVELNPDTCMPLSPPIASPSIVTGLAFSGDVLFVGTSDTGEIQTIDPGSGIPLGAFFVGFPVTGLGSSGEPFAPPPPLQSGDLLASTGQAGALIQIMPSTGVSIFRGSVGAFGPVTEIEFRDDGMLFGSTGGGFSAVIRIDPNTGFEDLVGFHDFGAVNGLEFVGGVLYGTYIDGPGAVSQLVIVDQDTAALTFVGSTGFASVAGLAYDVASGTMYGSTSGPDGGNLITIDLATGAGTLVGPTGFAVVTALEFGPDGTLYGGVGSFGPASGSLIEIDPSSGLGAVVAASGYTGLSGVSFVP